MALAAPVLLGWLFSHVPAYHGAYLVPYNGAGC